MDFWIRAAQLVLSLSILVVLHEFGHYIPAKIFKTRVEKFYLFFNPWFSLFKKKVGETEWGIGWLPLGGYVKIAGMVDESMDKEQLALPPQPWEFRSKKAWQRLIIMIGGVTVNLILGILIYIFVVFAYGVETIDSKDLKAGLAVHPYMEQFGIKSGDILLEVEGKPLNKATDGTAELLLRGAHKVKVQHPDGKIQNIILPADIDYKLFENGAFPVFSLRMKAEKIDHVIAVEEFSDQNLELKSGDIIYKINNITTDKIDDLNKLIESKASTEVISIRDKDTIKGKISSKIFSKKVLPVIPALVAGLKKGDKFLTINESEIIYHDQIQAEMYKNKGKKVTFTVLRNNQKVELSSTVSKSGLLGFVPKEMKAIDKSAIKTTYYSFGESIQRGWNMGFITLGDYIGQLKFLFTKKGASSVGGFGSIGKMFPTTWNWQIFWMNTAFISIVLAFMNILPIPALDGGHVVFLIYEIITGKEAPQKVLEYAQYVGFMLLLGLLIYANGNDIYTAFFK
jgi:regulator of sigma E protease